MNTLTLFNAFNLAQDRKESALIRRRSSFGIMSQGDPEALEYQHYQRLADKLRGRILERLATQAVESEVPDGRDDD